MRICSLSSKRGSRVKGRSAMKKRVTAISALILVVVLAAALVACVDDGDTNVGPFTYDIGSAEDFEGLRSRLGADYDQGVYNLNADLDLTGSEWTPIGDSVTNAFTGKLNGNGHTIRYSIKKETPEHTDVNAVAEEVFTGLFGAVSGAEISNLNIVVDIDVPIEGQTVYVGGITGYAYGDVKITGVTVSGAIRADIADIRVTTVGADGGSNTETYGMYMTAHVGGVAGYVIGNATIENVTSAVDLDVGKMDGYAVSNDYCRVNEVTAGGIAGTLRTVDLSSGVSNKTSIKANSLGYSGNISVYGATVNAGGLIGLGYRISGEDLRAEISDYDSMFVNGVNRLNAGVVAGMLDRADISRIVASAPVLEIRIANGRGDQSSYNVGGAVGYLSNYSEMDNVLSDVKVIDMGRSINNYTGGVVGMLHFSDIVNAVASGEIKYEGEALDSARIPISFSSDGRQNRENYYYIYSGGVIGKLYGGSRLDNVATEFKAYQGVVGEAMNGVEIVVIKENDGETIEAWLAGSGYESGMYVYEKSGAKDPESGEQKYKLTHKYSVGANVWFAYDRAQSDTEKVNVAGVNYVNGIGARDNTHYEDLRAAIEQAIG